ncbi:M42 family metallopeptidase [Deinococcus sonorensis]|uniref:M42 family metallopeptidase n=2 Tax=Deinococcus sonorensis TaxID=309891 RepID=A0AAU7UFI6_9DEIO
MPAFDLERTTAVLIELLNTPSPTGYTEAAVRRIEAELDRLDLPYRRTAKGGLVWTLPGTGAEHLTFSAHADTLGAMVKEIRDNGRLGLTQLGGYDWATIEGEEVQVHLQGGRVLTGTVVNTRQSTHVWGSALRDLKRDERVLEVRLDERTGSAAETRALGVEVGDFVSLDSRARLTPAGYIKGRHLDNKASVALFLGVSEALQGRRLRPTVSFVITVYEEVGHGAASDIPAGTTALIAVDMAAIGDGQTSSEHHVTLCVKDSSGPYDHQLGNRVRDVARRAAVDLKVDIYPYYSSDASAAWRAGLPCPTALIGPGVDASHAYERTHQDALDATARLMLALLD